MEKLEEEKKDLKETIKELTSILKSRAKQDKILIEELEAAVTLPFTSTVNDTSCVLFDVCVAALAPESLNAELEIKPLESTTVLLS